MYKLLVIEDNFAIRKTIVDILNNANYKVFFVGDGESAISLATEIIPDLILCDIMMPGLNGYEVLEKLQNIKSTATIPLIFLTAKTKAEDINFALGLGVDDYIVKPFKAKDLLNRVELRIQKSKKFQEVQNSNTKNSEEKTDLTEDSNIMLIVDSKPNFVKLSSIICIIAKSEYCLVQLSSGKELLVRKVLKQWENILPKNSFKRIHRSSIINLSFITKIEKFSKKSYSVYLDNIFQPLIISERYAAKLKKENLF